MIHTPRDKEDFSLVLGGPFFQLLRRSRLAGDHMELAKRRTVIITGIIWLPLLIFSLVSGTALKGELAIPFLYDIEVQVRFLLVVPLMIISEVLVHERIRIVKTQFLERKLIPDDYIPQFERVVQSAYRLRNSLWAELLIVVFVYAVGVGVVWRNVVTVDTSTWYAIPVEGGSRLSLAGYWYGFFSIPMMQFLLVRWYYRIFIWIRFLVQVKRIPLNLVPTHPDHVGGLGFLANTVQAFFPLAAVHGAILLAYLSTRIFYLDASLPDFKVEIISIVVFIMLLVLLPLFVFSGQLMKTKRRGINEYGVLASRYVNEFDRKWRKGEAPPEEPFIGSGDIQSLADLSNSYEIIRKMQVAPITRETLIGLAVAALLPIAPLALTMMPLQELLKMLAGIIM